MFEYWATCLLVDGELGDNPFSDQAVLVIGTAMSTLFRS